MGDVAIASVLAALVGGLTAWLTARSSAHGAVKAAHVTSLADLEREAGKRASEIYKDAIDQLERERTEDHQELAKLRDRVRAAESELNECRRACRQLARRFNRTRDAMTDEPDEETP